MSIPFTQFKFPNGRKEPVEIDMDPETEAKAHELIANGYHFEIEIHPGTQMVHADCWASKLDDEPVALFVCMNGPKVPQNIKEMVIKAYAHEMALGRFGHGSKK